MKKLILIAVAGLAILGLRMYANDANESSVATSTNSTTSINKNEKNATSSVPGEPAVSKLPAASLPSSPVKQVTPSANTTTPSVSAPSVSSAPKSIDVPKPNKLIMAPPTTHMPSSNTVPKSPESNKAVAAPAATTSPSAVNFQMQMAQIHQKIFSGFEQPDLIEFGQALEQAFNGALVTKEFDKGVNKLEDAAKDLAIAFGRNIEVNSALHLKIKQAFDTATKEFEALVRSGKIADLSGEVYLARILNATLSGLKIGFSRAEIMPENTPVPANLGLEDHAVEQPNMPKAPVTPAPKIQAPSLGDLKTQTSKISEPTVESKMSDEPSKSDPKTDSKSSVSVKS